MTKFLGLMEKLGVPVRGIIHVGANKGEELDAYRAAGARPVLWIEADPTTHGVLSSRLSGLEDHLALQALVTGVDGEEVDFNIANFGSQSSSIFEFGLHSSFFPAVKFENRVRMKTSTLDSLVAGTRHQPTDFNAMLLDIQGAELQALFGARHLLSHIDCVEIEISDAELYRGGAEAGQILSFMALNGFLLVDYLIGPTSYGDAVFMRSEYVRSLGGLSL